MRYALMAVTADREAVLQNVHRIIHCEAICPPPRCTRTNNVTARLPAPQASPKFSQDHQPATHTTGAQPPPTPDFHPPSICATHPPAGRRPNPATHPWRPKHQRQMAPTARRRRVKGPPQATHRRGDDGTGPPKSFWGRFRKRTVTSEKQPHTEEVQAAKPRGRLEDTKTLAHDGQTCSQPYTLFIGQKRARGSSRPVGRFGDFYSESKSGKSPKSA